MSLENCNLIEIRNLRTLFNNDSGKDNIAVDDVSFNIRRGESVAVVGESGCGKSVTALSIMRLVAEPPGRIAGGQIIFDGADLLKKSEYEMRSVRGNRISMIFQEPMTSLNPVFSVGDQIIEMITLHQRISQREARLKCIEMIRTVGIPSPDKRVSEYPHQMSGGMRQRIMIAMALSCTPQLLIADEPTTALDVTIQAQILDLMRDLRDRYGMATMLITHDLGIVAEFAEKVIVMYMGRVVEEADTFTLFRRPSHPYTVGLKNSLPSMEKNLDRLKVIKGAIPGPECLPSGCPFHPRCDGVQEICINKEPNLIEIETGHKVRCWYPVE
jgi:oligopeptide/dipeptide ABC transporter ATP-binding protein